MTTQTVAAIAKPYGWLRSVPFDLTLIVGVAILAIVSGAVVTAQPSLFMPILFLDLWLLGYHHVVSTFTRLAFDLESFRQNRFLVTGLPVIVVGAVVASAIAIGPWVLASLYLYWQWFHYTRQSYGLARIYARKNGNRPIGHPLLEQAAIYALPLWGILQRSYQNPGKFLGVELKCLPVPAPVLTVVGTAAVVLTLWWIANQWRLWRQGRLPFAYTLYMAGHMVIFTVGYLVIPNIDHGWLVLNVWHNAQYILIVWMYNNNRFKDGIDPQHRFLSRLSQPRSIAMYFGVCLLLSSAVYAILLGVAGTFTIASVSVLIVAYQTINFHHYIVDGIIWKVRKKPVQANLGLQSV